MRTIDLVRARIRDIIWKSEVPEDPYHAENTLKWVKKFKDGDTALEIAALGHDIERAVKDRKVLRKELKDYHEFKKAHSINSAKLMKEILEDYDIDESLSSEIVSLVSNHEFGSDYKSDILKDADGISFFDINLPYYFQRHDVEEVKRRIIWGYRRLSDRAKKEVDRMSFKNSKLNLIFSSSIETAKTSLKSG